MRPVNVFCSFVKGFHHFEDFDAHKSNLFFFFFLKRELMSCLETSKVLLIKTKLLLHYVWDFVGKEERAVFVNVVD